MLSIIIPAHNERENLIKGLSTLSNQIKKLPEKPVEVIVVLSADTSDGSEKLKVQAPIQIIRCKQKGRAVQMNMGATIARGNIFAFLHADIVPPANFIIDIFETMRQGYYVGLFSYKFDKSSPLLRINEFFTSKNGLFTGAGDQCLFISKDTFYDLDRFDEQQTIMEDFKFFEKIKKQRIDFKIVNNPLTVSARKYEENSFLKVNLVNFILFIMFKMGYSPESLKATHNTFIKLPNKNYK
ncbi:TIGR04283 family arsenosugar biosynthesis glycosyltransferase [Galbibacter sp. BG1]|uniref:TIGR04283 family arsenosugar biosynthesis glycosyltransferase n=1 Tax=Galbibacter sp. BG1 TaxID=1170699 RepID=UPI0015BD3F82|nr:TIGR04283 family arsenosugar biosynthesis glycosyltransferase [Galbibacter sp. BG1]QLE02865.1 TIGR04283 family arsenosugar biosynthesis glycosyltransferase [Galbibacter sp. BG1]